MNSLEDLFQKAQLSEAAYSSFSAYSGDPQAALMAEGFSEAQAAAFVDQWIIVDQYTAPGLTGSGLSATVFKNKAIGQYTFNCL